MNLFLWTNIKGLYIPSCHLLLQSNNRNIKKGVKYVEKLTIKTELRQMIVFFLDLEFHVTESDFVIRPGGWGGGEGGCKIAIFYIRSYSYVSYLNE